MPREREDQRDLRPHQPGADHPDFFLWHASLPPDRSPAKAGAHPSAVRATEKWVLAFAGKRKKHHPNDRASTQACSPIGIAVAPVATASLLAAVPSIARLAIPWRIAARRNRL